MRTARRRVVLLATLREMEATLATYSAFANALASGDIWVQGSRLHRSLDTLLAPPTGPVAKPAFSFGDPHAWINERAAWLDDALRDVERNLDRRDPALFAGERLRFPKEATDDGDRDGGRRFALACHGRCPLPESPTC